MKNTSSRKGLGKVSFLAKLPAITTELEEGYPITAIYEKYSNSLNVGYAQFTRYIKRHITKRAIPESPRNETVPLEPKAKPKRSFGEDLAKPNKNDLI